MIIVHTQNVQEQSHKPLHYVTHSLLFQQVHMKVKATPEEVPPSVVAMKGNDTCFKWSSANRMDVQNFKNR